MFVEKIRERLKSKFPGANLSKTRIEDIAARLNHNVTSEDQIDSVLDQADSFFPFEQIAREDDRTRSLEAAAKKPADQSGGQQKASDTPDDAPAWAKTLIETVNAQNLKIEGFEKGKFKETLSQKAAAALKAKNIPEAFSKLSLKNLSLEKEEEIENWVSEIAESYTDFQKTNNQSRFETALNPLEGNTNPDTVKTDIANWAAGKKAES